MSADSSGARIALFTDTHLGFTAPSARPCNAHENYLLLEECLCLARKLGAHAILHAGDFFNQNRLSSKKVIKAICALRRYGVSSFADHSDGDSIPMALIYGNHDNNDKILGLLEAAGAVSLLGHTQAGKSLTLHPLCQVVGGVELVVYGLDYHKAWQRDVAPEISFAPAARSALEDEAVGRGAKGGRRHARYTFLVLHQDYSDQVGRDKISLSFVDQWNHTHAPEERIDFVYIGHEHDETPPRDGETFTLLMPGSPHRQSRKGNLLNVRQEDRNFYLLTLPLQRKCLDSPPLRYCHLNRYNLLSGSFYHIGAKSIDIVTEKYRISKSEHDYTKIAECINTSINSEIEAVTNHAASLLCKRIMPCIIDLQKHCRELYSNGHSIESIVASLASLRSVMQPPAGSYSFHSLIAYLRYYHNHISLEGSLHSSPRAHSIESNDPSFLNVLKDIVRSLLDIDLEESEECFAMGDQQNQTVLANIRCKGLSEAAIKDAILSTNMLAKDISLPTIYAQFAFTILFKLARDPLQHTAEEQGLLASICNSFELISIELVCVDKIQRRYAHLYMNNRTFVEPLMFKADTIVNQQSTSAERVAKSAEKDSTCVQILLTSLQAVYDQAVSYARGQEDRRLSAVSLEKSATGFAEREPEAKQTGIRSGASSVLSVTSVTETGSSSTIVTNKEEHEDSQSVTFLDSISSDLPETTTQAQHSLVSDALAIMYMVPEILKCLQQDDGCMVKEHGVGRGNSTAKQLEEVRKTCTKTLRARLTEGYSSALATFFEAPSSTAQHTCRFTSLLQACDAAEANHLQVTLEHHDNDLTISA
ncbi:Mre11 [Giardia duodenalis]|uniref:Mre11 n=2 Tax=Giardia intestinalis TaxID=5741 RepID=E2RU53_GIAIC|nr:Mre11 [Giardia intestinalis]AAP35105.1 Mre11 [Giardia intestinalis]AAQ24513.1 Mre11 [Giardia intestinalis]KAE8302743.1 Mre11 [Giardia intestinalis]|eukprot:XP_001706276.1 Mre11 [Giardia lamblia ATCC 50803]